jgi:tetratricopeptide (TPR) repeat protein
MIKSISRAACVLCLLLAAGRAAADSDWDSARAAYDAGRFAEARALYERLPARGSGAAERLFNLGNTCYKMGDAGHAALFYRRAEWLRPRDPDIRANARIVWSQAGAPAPQEGRMAIFRFFSEDEWLWLGWAGYAMAFLLLGVMAFAPRFRRQGRTLCAGFAVLAVVAAAGWGAWNLGGRADELVVLTGTGTDARFAPLPDADIHFHLPVATLVRELDRNGEWRLVRLEGAVGWIPAAATEPVTPGRGRL